MNKRDFLKTVTTFAAACAAGRSFPAGTGGTAASTGLRLSKHVATTEGAPWVDQAVGAQGAGADGVIEVTSEKAAEWRGFGACFNELGWRSLGRLEPSEREAVLDRLFLPAGDLQFEYCRVPIGANDYSEDWYSHDEHAGDFDLSQFSIERDRRSLIPFISAALTRRPDLRLFASPWSPPTWLKDPPVYNYGKLIADQRHLDTYARYFLRFVEGYAAEGIRVHEVHVQNEPVASQKFPSCVMTGHELARFIGQHLGPVFERAGTDTEIWLGTLNGPEADERRFGYATGFNDYAFTVLNDDAARRHIKGVSYQWGGKAVVWRTRQAFPEFPVIQSENECGDGTNSWKYAWYVSDLIYHYLANDASGYLYWNMVLDPGGHSTWGWAQNSLLTVNPTTRTVATNPEYHILRHYSAFIHRGYRRLRCKGPWSGNGVAFEGPGGDLAVVVRNPLGSPRRIELRWREQCWPVQLPAASINTLVVS